MSKKYLPTLALVVSSLFLTACIGDNLKTDVVQDDGDSSSEVSATIKKSPVSEVAPAEENTVLEVVNVSSEEPSETVESATVVETTPSTPARVDTPDVVVEQPVTEQVSPPAKEITLPEATTVSSSGNCSPDVETYMQPLIANNSVSQSENQTYSITGSGCDDGVVTFQKRNGDVMPIVAFGLAGECRVEVHYTYHFSSETLVKEKSRSQCVNQDWSAWKTY